MKLFNAFIALCCLFVLGCSTVKTRETNPYRNPDEKFAAKALKLPALAVSDSLFLLAGGEIQSGLICEAAVNTLFDKCHIENRSLGLQHTAEIVETKSSLYQVVHLFERYADFNCCTQHIKSETLCYTKHYSLWRRKGKTFFPKQHITSRNNLDCKISNTGIRDIDLVKQKVLLDVPSLGINSEIETSEQGKFAYDLFEPSLVHHSAKPIQMTITAKELGTTYVSVEVDDLQGVSDKALKAMLIKKYKGKRLDARERRYTKRLKFQNADILVDIGPKRAAQLQSKLIEKGLLTAAKQLNGPNPVLHYTKLLSGHL